MYGFELTPEQQQLKDTVHKFAVEVMIPVAAKYDKEQAFPDTQTPVSYTHLTLPTKRIV